MLCETKCQTPDALPKTTCSSVVSPSSNSRLVSGLPMYSSQKIGKATASTERPKTGAATRHALQKHKRVSRSESWANETRSYLVQYQCASRDANNGGSSSKSQVPNKCAQHDSTVPTLEGVHELDLQSAPPRVGSSIAVRRWSTSKRKPTDTLHR